MQLSVAIATYNEEANIRRCLASVTELADEVVVVDGGSTDKTVEMAQSFGAKVIQTTNPVIFHINKQKALEACTGKWILQLDADEEVSAELKKEILSVINMSDTQIKKRPISGSKRRLFSMHQRLIEGRDGAISKQTGEIVAFFVPRRNYFLGKPMTYAGMYPDGVIRLVKNKKARFPSKSVHEQIEVDGEVAWLEHDLFHYSNPTLARYISGADTYTRNEALRLKKEKLSLIFLVPDYLLMKPVMTFLSLFIRHKGILDGVHGFLFSLFSAIHFPVILYKYFSL